MATVTQVAIPADVESVIDKFTAIRAKLGARLIGRDVELSVILTALVAKQHVMLHGRPGNAKSMTVDGVLSYLPDIRLFKTQAYKNTTPEQYLGPISFKAMENDDFMRVTKGKFADCHVSYIDETPRAPRSVLPAFQGGMVEREFDAGHGPEPIDLMTFIGTSNHIPEDEELEAFFDRFLFKLVVDPPQSQDAFMAILRGGADRRRGGRSATAPDPALLVSLKELKAVQEFATQVVVPDAIFESIAEIWANLVGIGVEPSIRRYNDAIGGLQSYALVNGRAVVAQDDILLLQHVLWSAEQERDDVYKEVVKFASEWEQRKHELVGGYDEQRDKLVKLQTELAQNHGKVERAMTTTALDIIGDQSTLRPLVEKHLADATEANDAAALERVLEEMDRAAQYISERLLGGMKL